MNDVIDSSHPVTGEKTCRVLVDGITLDKRIGDVWSSAYDLCLKHTCEIDQIGEPAESTFREYCSHSCLNVCKIISKFDRSLRNIRVMNIPHAIR